MILRFFFIFLITFYSASGYATVIRVIDLQQIIDNNKYLILFYEEIKNDQSNHTLSFKNQELELKKNLDEINKLKLILDSDELEKEINNYNDKLNAFNLEIEKFNYHYDQQISKFKDEIIQEVLQILKDYSADNQIDLILDANNYILSSNAINITDIIFDKSNKIELEIDFEKYN